MAVAFQGFPAWPVSVPAGWPAWASGGNPGTLLLGPPGPVPQAGGGPGNTIVPAWSGDAQAAVWEGAQPEPEPEPAGGAAS